MKIFLQLQIAKLGDEESKSVECSPGHIIHLGNLNFVAKFSK